MVIRPEVDEDAPGVRELLLSSFDSPAEADLVDDLRAQARPYVALVAEADSHLAGHVALTEVTLEPARDDVLLALGLAPLAVDASHRREGIGSALVRAAIESCRGLEADLLVVLGDPVYYSRFGFVAAERYGLRCDFDAPGEAFQALALRGDLSEGTAALVRFRPEFDCFR